MTVHASQREEWMAALRRHAGAIEKLSRTLAALDSAPAGESMRRQIEFTTAQLTRHRIDLALLAAQLGSSANQAQAPDGAYSHSIVAGGFDEMS